MPPKFPGPYVNETREADPMMERVPPDSMDIGARSSGLPKGQDRLLPLDHVGGTTGTRK